MNIRRCAQISGTAGNPGSAAPGEAAVSGPGAGQARGRDRHELRDVAGDAEADIMQH
jgi:hypothetical protein